MLSLSKCRRVIHPFKSRYKSICNKDAVRFFRFHKHFEEDQQRFNKSLLPIYCMCADCFNQAGQAYSLLEITKTEASMLILTTHKIQEQYNV